MKIKVQLFSVPCDEPSALTAVQQKLNQWQTIGLLIKYEMHTTATHIIFNVALRKEA
tara:strand:+ start:361 stop:531 length:171 start_codon:yes stop_codon:yes gene_type:complete